MKTLSYISGIITDVHANGTLMLTPDFDGRAEIKILPSKKTAQSAKMLIPGDRVCVEGQLDMASARKIKVTPVKITRISGMTCASNFIQIKSRTREVDYDGRIDDLFHVEFDMGFRGSLKTDFTIDRNQLSHEALRDFAKNNERYEYTFTGVLQFVPAHNKLQLCVKSISR